MGARTRMRAIKRKRPRSRNLTGLETARMKRAGRIVSKAGTRQKGVYSVIRKD